MSEEEKKEQEEEEQEEEENEENEDEEQEEDEGITLQLGDIIKITDPDNEIFNEQTFVIDYIDKTKIKLINTSTLDTSILKIKEDGTLGEGTIEEIALLKRNEYPGYAKQNDLLPGTWVNIYFGGDVPAILTGEITNLEEDMIEIRTYPEKETIYINFNYSGIPEDIPIETIEIRQAPEKRKEAIEVELEGEGKVAVADEDEDQGLQDQTMSKEDQEEEAESIIDVPQETIKDHIREFLLQGDEIVFGTDEEFGQITQFVEMTESKQRYSIEAQANDLLDEMLSTVPSSQRTSSVLTNIHIMIERFKQLRTQFSVFDENGNITSSLVKESSWRPLIPELTTFKKLLYWLIPVVKNIKKIYGVSNNLNDYQDVVSLNITEDMLKMKQSIETYKSNNFPDEQNKYIALINDINPQFTPFEGINPETLNEIIYETHVGTDINAIIDNLGEFYSSIVENDMIKMKRFVIQRYNLGLNRLAASQLTGGRMIATRVRLTMPDDMSIKSILTLPEPVVRFSRINLSGTSILDRANLSTTFLNYWQLLKQKTNVNNITIDADSQDIADETFIDNIKNYVLSNPDPNLTMAQSYQTFIEKIIPKTRVLFNLIKKYIVGKVSLVDAITYLEPFLIYSDDLTYMQYVEINKFLSDKISSYNKLFVERSREFHSFKRDLPKQTITPTKNSIYTALRDGAERIFEQGYNDQNASLETNSELLRRIMTKDAGRLYNSAIALESVPFMFPSNLTEVFEMDKNNVKKDLVADSKNNKCNTYVIAKQYRVLEELDADNDKDIYFDKKFDNTQYSIIETDEYEKAMAKMEPEDFAEFLVSKLIKVHKLSNEDAIYLADTLISGIKKVHDNQYAFIPESDSITYYRRVNNRWQLDENVTKDSFATDRNLLCNIQEDCIEANEKCISMDMNKLQVRETVLNDMLSQFDQKYALSKQEMEAKFQGEFDYNMSISGKLSQIDFERVFKYNNKQYNLGVESGNSDEFGKNATAISPYAPLLNLIMGQRDFVKKQNDIIRFAMEYTREALEEESIHWRYCIKTNVPLLPTFQYSLACAFINDAANYSNTIDQLVQSIGKLSDDGDAWVDKNSGRVIKMIDFDVEEGYEGGFQIRSRETMEADAGASIIKGLADAPKVVTHEIRVCNNIVTAFAASMGINIEDQREFIVNISTSIFLATIPEESIYKKEIQEMAKKNKTIPSFKELYNSTLLYITMAAFLIGVQTNIPSIKTRKTYPGCIRSFDGYPIEGAGDDSALHYLACIAYKIRTSIEPWSALMKKKETVIAEKIKATIQAYFISHPDVIRKFQEKAEYVLTNPIEVIPQEHDISRWIHFLPPLVPIHITKLTNVTTEFKSKFLQDLKSGYSGQRESLLVVESKIIQFSLSLQEKIQKIVAKKTPILANMVNDPFLENACCNDKDTKQSTIDYFIKEDPEIKTCNTIVQELTNILDDVVNVTKAYMFYSNLNTKLIYPSVSSEFNEETIYRAFIVYCKFNTIFPLSEELVALCSEKPANIGPNESMQEMITKLKNDGRNYTNASLLRLLQIINRKNIIHMTIDTNTSTSVQKVREVIEKMDEEDETIVYPALRKMLEENVDTFDMAIEADPPIMRALKNHLARTNAEMKATITDFIGKYNKAPNSQTRHLDVLLDQITTWNEEETQTFGIIDSDGYNFISFIKTYIHNIVNIFPNIILNSVDYDTIKIPKYLGLSPTHEMDIKKIIKEYYTGLRPFYQNKILGSTLNAIQVKGANLLLLANETPYFTAIKYGDKETYSVFDKRTSSLLFEHYFLLVLTEYVNLSTNESMLFEQVDTEEHLEDIFTVEDLEERSLKTDVVNQTFENEILLQGNQKHLKTNIANLLLAYLHIMQDHKDIVCKSYASIMDNVFKLQEREKDTFTDRLKAMTDEERNVDNILKANKLGDWSKGLQKGLTSYVKETYDEEREFMDKITQNERILRQNADVTDNNINQYMEDFLEQMDSDAVIEQDAYNMSDMNDDFDDGNFEADEVENQEDYL